jgi:hypothetical protein
MARSRFNPQRVKINYSYRVEVIARMLSVHKNTVRAWLKDGLATIDDQRPAMVQGKVLRAFLETKRTAKRSRCGPGTFYCLKCRAPRKPALGMVDFVQLNCSSGNLKALCDECDTLMHRATNIARIPEVMPNLNVRVTVQQSRLIGSSNPSLNCDSDGERPHHA